MLVRDAIIHTRVVRPGMPVRDVFDECGRVHVQALPFVDSDGKLTFRVTLKFGRKIACLPRLLTLTLFSEISACAQCAFRQRP